MPAPKGLFFGLTTIDLQYLVDDYPPANTKTKAGEFAMQTGGPASNAAIAFAHLGGEAALFTQIGTHGFRDMMIDEYRSLDVDAVDLLDGRETQPVLSSVVSARADASRTIFNSPLPYRLEIDSTPWKDRAADVALIDGFLFPACRDFARAMRGRGVPVVFDGGSWKDATRATLEEVDVAICSANFLPPGVGNSKEVMDFLVQIGIKSVAVTRGEQPTLHHDGETIREIPVPKVNAVDSLGAGDIFHGAFAYYHAQGLGFADALNRAATVASRSCETLGTRTWMSA